MHSVEVKEYPDKYSREEISEQVRFFVENSGDGYGTERVIFLPEILDGKDEAYDYLKKKVEGVSYPGYAVRFREKEFVDNAKTVKLREKMKELMESRKNYKESHSPGAFSSEFATCSGCGSKLKRMYLKTEFCPLCGFNMLSDSVKKRLMAYDEKEKKIRKEIMDNKNYDERLTGKTSWLVWFEYHC